MQALPADSADTDRSSSALKVAPTHQHGPCFWPVSRSISIAQRLSWPHNGQRVGSMSGLGVVMGVRVLLCRGGLRQRLW